MYAVSRTTNSHRKNNRSCELKDGRTTSRAKRQELSTNSFAEYRPGGNFNFDGHEDEVPSSSTPETAPPTDSNDKKNRPNRPHPTLEYPLLYFGLKKWPWLFENIKRVYKIRWRLSYPLQKKVPLSRALRKLGIHLTWGEMLLLAPFWIAIFCAMLYTWAYPSVSVTGHVARTALIACFGFAQRNSIITLLIGMPIDRTLFYHKLSGRVAFVATIGHAWAFYADPHFQSHFSKDEPPLSEKLASSFDGQVNTSGTFMAFFVLGLVVTSLPYFRRKMFEVFYYLHILFVGGVVIGALFHTGILVPLLVAATWGVDLFLRSIVMARWRYPKTATLRIMSDTVVELSFPKVEGFDYNPGQYIYISLPDLSYLEWHPFSISSAPKMKSVTLHIRRAGDWTNALYELAKKKSEVPVMMEGPYGSLGVNLVDDRYKMIMLVSGGIGITPMQSICDQLLFEQAKARRQLKKVMFIWTDRDPVMMEAAPVVRRSSSIALPAQAPIIGMEQQNPTGYASDDAHNSATIFSQLLTLLPPGKATDQELEELYESLDAIMDIDAEAESASDEDSSVVSVAYEKEASITDDPTDGDFETTLADNNADWQFEDPEDVGEILDMQLYMTGRGPSDFHMPNATVGRPDLKQLFLDMKEEARAKGEKRVAVCVCSPPKISAICRKACIVYSDKHVRFDFHTESMEG